MASEPRRGSDQLLEALKKRTASDGPVDDIAQALKQSAAMSGTPCPDRVLQVHPTRRCNLTCAHAYGTSAPFVREELPLPVLAACLQDAVALGYRRLALSGGEPLLYGALPEALACARGLGMVTTLATSGMLATSIRWEQIAGLLDVVAVSIDGTPAEHDAIRRTHGAFAKAVASLQVLRSSGIPFRLDFTLAPHNLDSLDFVVRLAATHGAHGVRVQPSAMSGTGAATPAGRRPDALLMVAALCEATRLGKEMGVAVQVDFLGDHQVVGCREQVVPRRPVTRLADVAPVLVVRADAFVLPLALAVDRSLWLGSLHEAPLATLACEWLELGAGNRLADACERTWADVAVAGRVAAVSWHDEVALRTRPQGPARNARRADRPSHTALAACNAAISDRL